MHAVSACMTDALPILFAVIECQDAMLQLSSVNQMWLQFILSMVTHWTHSLHSYRLQVRTPTPGKSDSHSDCPGLWHPVRIQPLYGAVAPVHRLCRSTPVCWGWLREQQLW